MRSVCFVSASFRVFSFVACVFGLIEVASVYQLLYFLLKTFLWIMFSAGQSASYAQTAPGTVQVPVIRHAGRGGAFRDAGPQVQVLKTQSLVTRISVLLELKPTETSTHSKILLATEDSGIELASM